jgi:hypothetical protein
MLQGWHWRDKREMQRLATLASWVTAPHLKKPISPEELLSEKKERQKTTPEESRAVVEEMASEMLKGGEQIIWPQ